MNNNDFPKIPIYVINLPNRSDRKKHMKNMLIKLGVNTNNIIFSCDNTLIKMLLKNDVCREKLIVSGSITEKAAMTLNDAYIANALTQLDYIKLIAHSNQNGIIVEDDIIPIVNNVSKKLKTALDELPNDADILYLEMCYEDCTKIKKVTPHLYKLFNPACTAGILYTPQGARKILKLCLPVFDGIDLMFPQLIKQNKINAYGISGMLFAQDEYFGSDANRHEIFKNIHRVRAPICSNGKMDAKHIFPIPQKGTVINHISNNIPDTDQNGAVLIFLWGMIICSMLYLITKNKWIFFGSLMVLIIIGIFLNYNSNYCYIKKNFPHDKSLSKSQYEQDWLALKHHKFKENGNYLEIGVYDGENDNNTVIMDRIYNWKGVCIDPFMKNMDNRTSQNFKVALGSEQGTYTFRGDGSSGLSGIDKFANSNEHNSIHVDTVSKMPVSKVTVRRPFDIIAESKLPNVIDYMSLDVEGSEMDILKSFPFDKYCIKYATIETNNDKKKEKEMEDFMLKLGYKYEGHHILDHIFSNQCNTKN